MNTASQAANVAAPVSVADLPNIGFGRRLFSHLQPIKPIGIAIKEERMLTTPRFAAGVVANRIQRVKA